MPQSQPLTLNLEQARRRAGASVIAGLDEVGRGPLAGPLLTAAVILPLDRPLTWLTNLRDSKQLTARQREALAPQIEADAVGIGYGWVPAAEIDQVGLSRALRLAACRALEQLPMKPDLVLADGRDRLHLPVPTEMIIKGDAAVPSIAAAAVLAKIARDRWMLDLHQQYPAYGFDRHKGYASPQHLRALRQHGPCPEHRRSFAPLRQLPLNLHAAS